MKLFLTILLVFVASYFLVPLIFFQQDEILGFGLFIKEGAKIILSGLADGRVRHFVPVTMSLSYSIFKFFGLKYQIYNTFALLFHLINGCLVFLIAKHFFKKRSTALIAVLIFFSSNVAAQLIMWPVINLNALSLTFALLTWLAVIKKRLFWTPLLFLLAVFSVEYSAGLALFVPFAIFLTFGKSLKEKALKTIPFGVTVLVYSVFRLWPILAAGGAGLGISGEDRPPVLIAVFKLVTRYFGQLFFGQEILLSLSKLIQKAGGLSSLGTAYAEMGIFPILSTFLGLILIIGAVFFYQAIKKDKEYSQNFLLCLTFILFNSLPFLLVPGQGSSAVIASRYMYFGLAGSAFVITYVYNTLTTGKRTRLIANIALLVFVALGAAANFTQAKALYDLGRIRLGILNSIKKAYPHLPEKVVFFAESDTSYYGLSPEEKIFPFQSGLGQTLLLFYYEEEKIPRDFYPGEYLWGITSQGYREVQNRGFGFFRDKELLKSTLEDYNIPTDAVIAFSWSGGTEQLKDVTVETRRELLK